MTPDLFCTTHELACTFRSSYTELDLLAETRLEAKIVEGVVAPGRFCGARTTWPTGGPAGEMNRGSGQ